MWQTNQVAVLIEVTFGWWVDPDAFHIPSARVARTSSLLARRLRLPGGESAGRHRSYGTDWQLITDYLLKGRWLGFWLPSLFLFKEGDVMKIAMYVHYYLPYHFAGSEIYVHELP